MRTFVVRFPTNPQSETLGDGTRRSPPNYFSRPQQYRLLMMVSALLLVLLLMAEAAKPKNWQWMWSMGTARAIAMDSATDADTFVPNRDAEKQDVAGQAIDTGLPSPGRAQHPPGVFVAVSDPPALTGQQGHQTKGLFPGVSWEQLQPIRDDTVFRSAEAKTWFAWCGLLKAAVGLKDAPREVTFLQLFRQPQEYRGRLIQVSGIVRRAHRVAAQPNEHGLESYYRCWLFPHDGASNPIVVYALNMPASFPVGMNLHEEVAFAGLFFKRWAYQAKGGMMTAPLVLAAGGDWVPRATPIATQVPSLAEIIVALGLAALIGGSVAWWVYRQNDTDRPRLAANKVSDLAPNALVIVCDKPGEE